MECTRSKIENKVINKQARLAGTEIEKVGTQIHYY